MLVNTYYDGKSYALEQQYNVDSIVEKRWIKNGIAELIPAKPKKTSTKEDI